MKRSLLIVPQPPVSGTGTTVEAIASGVRARVEEESGCTRIITEKTVHIARAMKISESDIQEWLKQEEQRLRDIKELLRKLSERRPETTS